MQKRREGSHNEEGRGKEKGKTRCSFLFLGITFTVTKQVFSELGF